ncbi:sigma-70 family RNA polymerase sigma factor [Roseburia sp. AM16-25]|jgi:RNA polymerase sporulation-specific sigma factor|uniref:sigma-70 family RNA polymerase sigma factor n=1 Tax=Roseburia sp. AM16-25 TaxID=2292065 RepID=UPI000E4727F2|nr:sigma-70 family RNA polymerase sigma factor [Roseburia sp. AM16-25]RHO30757.1 RNA polymerase sigma-G factor [Roseburia sp. AM16-25]
MDGITERIERAQRGDKGERDRLVVDNMPLVWSMVGRFSSSGKDKEELFQIGMIGLMQAIDRFDTTYDVRFSTYAVPLILGEIRRFLRDDNPIKVSRTIAEHRKQIQTLQQGQEDISVDQIVEKTGLTREDVVLAMASARPVTSIYETAYDSGESQVLVVDQLEGKEKPMEEEVVEEQILALAMQALSAEEKRLIQMRFFENMTQTEIAGRLGMTQVQVSRREKKILQKMREFILF